LYTAHFLMAHYKAYDEKCLNYLHGLVANVDEGVDVKREVLSSFIKTIAGYTQEPMGVGNEASAVPEGVCGRRVNALSNSTAVRPRSSLEGVGTVVSPPSWLERAGTVVRPRRTLERGGTSSVRAAPSNKLERFSVRKATRRPNGPITQPQQRNIAWPDNLERVRSG
jgi:hypothetical protein